MQVAGRDYEHDNFCQVGACCITELAYQLDGLLLYGWLALSLSELSVHGYQTHHDLQSNAARRSAGTAASSFAATAAPQVCQLLPCLRQCASCYAWRL